MANRTTGLHREVVAALLEKIEDDPYPSTTMMDMVEEMLEEDDVETYTQILLDKVRADRFPSTAILSRIRAFG